MNFQNSAKLCREREAHHKLIAENAILSNVRQIALKAALAWADLAEEAEKSEAGRPSDLSVEDAAIALGLKQESETPNQEGFEP